MLLKELLNETKIDIDAELNKLKIKLERDSLLNNRIPSALGILKKAYDLGYKAAKERLK